ncbi:MAG: hypothetical protein HQM10_01675 [Candidatus Riflebacteria bacterium]|nr:hypothetical protein [Candidatus Riflebacteria bacterium]
MDRKGNIIIFLIVFFAVIVLQSMIAIPDNSNLQKRLFEDILLQDLKNIRKGIASASAENPELLNQSDPLLLIKSLADNYPQVRFSRATAAFSIPNLPSWRIVYNHVKNPSFEIDDGTSLDEVENHGDITPDNGIPDGWRVDENVLFQTIPNLQAPATYILSFWFKPDTVTDLITVKATRSVDVELFEFSTATPVEWNRYFKDFYLPVESSNEATMVLSFSHNTATGLLENVMVEKWATSLDGSGNIFPSAYVEATGLSIKATEESLQHSGQFYDIMNSSGQKATVSYWYQW